MQLTKMKPILNLVIGILIIQEAFGATSSQLDSDSAKIKRDSAMNWPAGFKRRHSLVERSHAFNPPQFRKANFLEKEVAPQSSPDIPEEERNQYEANQELDDGESQPQSAPEVQKSPISGEEFRNGHQLRAFGPYGENEDSKLRAKKTSGARPYKEGPEKEETHPRPLVKYSLMDSEMNLQAKNNVEETAPGNNEGSNGNPRAKAQLKNFDQEGSLGKNIEPESRVKKTPLKREDSDGIREEIGPRKSEAYFKNSPRRLSNARRHRPGGAADFANGYEGPNSKLMPSLKEVDAGLAPLSNPNLLMMNGESGSDFDYRSLEEKEPQNFQAFMGPQAGPGQKRDQARSPSHNGGFFENDQEKFLEDRPGGAEKTPYYHGGFPRSLDKPRQEAMYYDPVEIEKRGELPFVDYPHFGAEDSYPMLYNQRSGQSYQNNVFHGKRWKRSLTEKIFWGKEPGRKRRDETTCLPKSTKGRKMLGPDNFFCPGEPTFLSNRTEIHYTAKDTENMHWNGHGLVFTPDQVGGEKQCLILSVIGDTYATLYGWKVKGYKLPCQLQKKHKVTGGLVKSYVVRYMVTTGKWNYINDGRLPKVYMSEGDLKNPDIETQEMLGSPLNLAAVQFCPLSSEGATPVLYVELVGCRLYPKDEFARLYFDPLYTEPYTCSSHLEWAGEDLIFESNAGRRPSSALFSSAGFTFTQLPKLALNGNSDFYLEAKLPAPSIVFRLQIAGSLYGVSQGMVSSFTLAYLDLSNVWRFVLDGGGATKRFDTGLGYSTINADQHTVLTLPHPVVTGVLRLYPQSWQGNTITLRFDVEYCDIFPVDDREPECKIPYNLISQAILGDRTIQTLLTEENATLDDPYGYLFQMKKESQWQNHDSYLRATFPEHMPRKVTSLVLSGGSTLDGRTGLVTDFNLRYGVVLPGNPATPPGVSSSPYDQHPHPQGQTASTPPHVDATTLSLSTSTANAVIKSDKAEDTRYVFLFNPPLLVRFLELYPQSWHYLPIVRMGLRGCHAGGSPYPVKYYHPGVAEPATTAT